MTHPRGSGVTRPPFPVPAARGTLPIVDSLLFADLLPEVPAHELSAGFRHYLEPFVGITEDGTPRPGLYQLDQVEVRPSRAADAARRYLSGLAPYQRVVGALPMDAPEWRLWTNAIPTWIPKGMRLERLGAADRERALAVIEASLSSAGYTSVRSAMRLNANLGELIGDYQDTLTEFAYWFTVFGEPSSVEPWGWQLMGHHIDLHCVFVGGQMVFAPSFLGAEPTSGSGRFEGVAALDEETETGLAFRRALGAEREHEFVLSASIRAADLPPELAGPWNGRHVGGAGRDNLVLRPEGIVASSLSRDQQDGLVDLLRVYLGRLPEQHAERKLAQVLGHLDETRFLWRGGQDDESAFYYRIHSPVLLVEYDNHPGVFLANPEPARFHVHTIVREPHGNDYGKNLLAQHYAAHHHA
ncbi:hypothetical protein FHX39_002022 [Friedmanniella antarctica]|uniref:DUF3500 domain-containing protein n=1 Tax=Microlunatus antarcticus TaxID=53388 RepID=A0A7W5JVM4_9ACTN|nr:DUF3500 domain-containing protein [Microlunatus antarcticus]MBB3327078.1 hypothetical protein [Microlunatus antarcticus]